MTILPDNVVLGIIPRTKVAWIYHQEIVSVDVTCKELPGLLVPCLTDHLVPRKLWFSHAQLVTVLKSLETQGYEWKYGSRNGAFLVKCPRFPYMEYLPVEFDHLVLYNGTDLFLLGWEVYDAR